MLYCYCSHATRVTNITSHIRKKENGSSLIFDSSASFLQKRKEKMNQANIPFNGLTRLTESPESRGGLRQKLPLIEKTTCSYNPHSFCLQKKRWHFACLVAVTADLYHGYVNLSFCMLVIGLMIIMFFILFLIFVRY